MLSKTFRLITLPILTKLPYNMLYHHKIQFFSVREPDITTHFDKNSKLSEQTIKVSEETKLQELNSILQKPTTKDGTKFRINPL